MMKTIMEMIMYIILLPFGFAGLIASCISLGKLLYPGERKDDANENNI